MDEKLSKSAAALVRGVVLGVRVALDYSQKDWQMVRGVLHECGVSEDLAREAGCIDYDLEVFTKDPERRTRPRSTKRSALSVR